MFGSPVKEGFSLPFAGNRDESTTPEPTHEYPGHDEMAMLEFLILCDLSGACHGFMMIF
jgi:hypothetical protein